jgi:hypothetical protein
MAVLTFEQVEYLKPIIQRHLNSLTNEGEIAFILSTLEGLDKDPQTESVKDDITVNAENMGVELTDDQLNSLVPQVLNYDQNDYNSYINDLIDKEIPHDDEEDTE